MSFDFQNFRDLVSRQHVGDLSRDEFSEFEAILKGRKEARDYYRQACRLDALLRRESEQVGRPVTKISHWKPVMAVAAGLILVGTVLLLLLGGGNVGFVAETENAVWAIGEYQKGEKLRKGTKLELASGAAQIQFQSGAVTNLTGPAAFKLKTKNSGYLFVGSAESVASVPEATGFTVEMPVAAAVDTGTVFRTKVGIDKSSLVSVSDGNVQVEIGSKKWPLSTGMGLNIEAGNPTVIYQIEKGNETPDFEFPTIAPPSSRDYAEGSRDLVKVQVKGRMGLESKNDADPANLTNGRGQSTSFAPQDSFFFKGDEFGSIIFDLGKKIPVSKINTYSWHRDLRDQSIKLRAFQHYHLWAFPGDEAPGVSDDPAAEGWIHITEVNSDEFFGIEEQSARPPQLACSIQGAGGILGKYRFLYFDIHTSTLRNKGERNVSLRADHTLFGEIDIYTEE